MDGVILLILFTVPSYLIARRRGIAFLKAIFGGKPRSNSDILSAAILIVCAVGLVLNVAVIIDQGHYLCISK